MAFKEIKDRDAWNVIRGFVYQVDTTILRWIDLKEGEALELERGEDIDKVARHLLSGEEIRRLEQIKYREESALSLNQQAAVDILHNYFVHQRDNPDSKLLFRYVTNAAFTTERPAIFADGKRGIEAWMELFHSSEPLESDARLIILKEHLQARIGAVILELQKLPAKQQNTDLQKSWKEFADFLQDDSNVIQFIKGFEWSFGNYDFMQIIETIKLQLQRSQLAADVQEAENLYQRLFLFVFKLLCEPTLKRIDPSDLQKQIAQSELSSPDRQMLKMLMAVFQNIEPRVEALESSQGELSNQLSSIIKTLEGPDYDAVFAYRVRNISLTAPQPMQGGSTRAGKVKDIIETHKQTPWIFIQGINGTGKSQLAALASSNYKSTFWLDLRVYNTDPEKSLLLIETCLAEISRYNITTDRNVWLNNVVSCIPGGSIIVFNDLPRLEVGSQLTELITLLANKIAGTSIRIISTSNFAFPNTIVDSNPGIFNSYTDLEFTDDEILEYLANSGAPDSIAPYLTLIVAATKRNPRLVSAIIRHLKSIQWGKDSLELITTLFKNDFSVEVLEDAQLSISKLIRDDDSKELLYRLSLIQWDFKFPLAKAIAEIEKTISHPQEKLHDLKYVWIQEREGVYSVSPLIYDIGENNLLPEVIEGVHVEAGRSILRDKKLNVVTASRAITSFIRGKDFDMAGLVLLKTYQSANSSEEINLLKEWGYLAYWNSNDLPQSMSVMMRAFLRHEQIRIFRKIDKDFTYQLSKLQEYAKDGSISVTEKFVLNSLSLANFDGGNLSGFWEQADSIAQNWSNIDSSIKNLVSPQSFGVLLWMPIKYISSSIDVENWFKSIDGVEKQLGIDFFSHEISPVSISMLTTKLVSANGATESTATAAILEQLQVYFRKRKLEILDAIVTKEIIAIEFKNNVDRAEAMADQFLQTALTSDAQYLIYDKLGRLFYHSDLDDKSKPFLLKAIGTNCTSQLGFIETLVYSATVISRSDKAKPVELLQRAVALASESEDYPELDYIQLMAEFGIALWLNDDYGRSFNVFEHVVEQLLSAKERLFNQKWTHIFQWSGHALGYIASLMGRGTPPMEVEDGSDYFKPYVGMLSFNHKDVSDLFKEKNMPVIVAQLAVFADGINNLAKAYQWSLRAFDMARKNGDDQVFMLISTVCSQYSLASFKTEEAFESYLLSTAVSSHLKGDREQLKSLKFGDLLSQKPSQEWDNAEDASVSFAIVPLFVMVLTAHLEVSPERDSRLSDFTTMIRNYISKASNKDLWQEILQLTESIINRRITEAELVRKANSNSSQNLQMLCIFGTIFISRSSSTQLVQMINGLPFLTKLFIVTKSVIKHCLVPFVRIKCIEIYKNSYVGDRATLEKMIKQIESVDPSLDHAIQLMIQPVFNELTPKIADDRRRWLFELEKGRV